MRMNESWARGIPLAALLIAFTLVVVPLNASEAPYLHVRQFLEPGEIYVSGTGEVPDIATLTLVLEGAGLKKRFPIDCILVVDVSATAAIAEAKRFAFDITELFASQDRIGLVSFATSARLDLPLTSDKFGLKAAIADLETGGRSAFGEALQLARKELVANGRGDAILVEILLTDGQSNIGCDPKVEGEVAAEAGIKVIPVGIGNLINRNLLEEFASKTGGVFFKRPTGTTVDRIKDLLYVDLAAQGVTVDKVLPPELSYYGASPAPIGVKENADGTTTLTWKIGEITIGEQWLTQIALKAKKKGSWPTDQGSSVSFAGFRGVEEQISIPALELAAIEPNWPPIAAFSHAPASPTTTDIVEFADESSDEDGQIAAWLWDFGDGEKSEAQSPEHRYSHSGTYAVTLVVIDDRSKASEPQELNIEVLNSKPMALFICEPKKPRMGVETMLDASGSVDTDGHITSYDWDFDGDEIFDQETASSEVLHTFLKAGEVTVILKVTDDEGGESELYEKALKVLPCVSAIRTIETGLPDDETIAVGTVKVTVMITLNTTLNGLTLHEAIPDGWALTEVDHGRATFREETVDWLYLETLLDGDVREVSYTLTAPCTSLSNTDEGREQLTINGVVGSSSPRVSQMVLGEDKVTRVAALPIPVVISRWDSEQGKIDLYLPEQIAFDQIQYAVSRWLSGNVVPYTDNLVIDLDIIRDLIAYWLTDTSVHDPLP